MHSEFVVEWEIDPDETERGLYLHSTSFEHLHEVLDFISVRLCAGHEVAVTPYWRRTK